jgi:hypothetical protein
MLINPTKTTCMFIGTAQRIATVTNELNINLENQFIKNVNTKKLLGIYILGTYIDNNLDWKEQVDHICKNINSRLFVKHFDLNILKLADNLILHGNLFQRMAELYANDFFIIFVFGRIMDKKPEVIVLLVYSDVIIDCFKLSFHKNR